MYKRKIVTAALFLLAAGFLFPQATGLGDASPFGIVPADILRPRREELPRYPVDTVIGPLGPGRASRESYEFARTVAAALLAGNMDVPVLANVNRIFLEGYMATLNVVNPRSFRLGGGQESPDGSVSFLVRFVGRDHGVTGELFVRREERRAAPPPPPAEPAYTAENGYENGDEGETDAAWIAEAAVEEPPAPPPPPVQMPGVMVWVFDELVLESPRTREEENEASQQRFGFSVYHRLF